MSDEPIVKEDIYMDDSYSISSEDFIPDTPCPSPEKIESGLETLFFQLDTMTSKYYYKPHTNSSGAKDIWIHSGLPSVATQKEIEWSIINWAYKNGTLTIENGIPTYITWKNSGYNCSSSWAVFMKWLLFSCGGY